MDSVGIKGLQGYVHSPPDGIGCPEDPWVCLFKTAFVCFCVPAQLCVDLKQLYIISESRSQLIILQTLARTVKKL